MSEVFAYSAAVLIYRYMHPEYVSFVQENRW